MFSFSGSSRTVVLEARALIEISFLSDCESSSFSNSESGGDGGSDNNDSKNNGKSSPLKNSENSSTISNSKSKNQSDTKEVSTNSDTGIHKESECLQNGIEANKKKSYKWRYNDDSLSESDNNKEIPPSSEQVEAKRGSMEKPKTDTNYNSNEFIVDIDEDNGKTVSKWSTGASVSGKEPSEDDRTHSEDLLKDYTEPLEPVPEEKCETIGKILAQRRGKKGVTGSNTTMYHVEENGDPNEGTDPNDLENTEQQYLIKWKDRAHVHNTWESADSLKEQKVKEMKKLENYIKKDVKIQEWMKRATRENIEFYEYKLELSQELLQSYNNVERIIAKCNKLDGKTDYYIKWENLSYADSTWEDSILVQKRWPKKIKEFEDREQSKQVPTKHCTVLKYRPKFHKVQTQPSYMTGVEEDLVLRDYQMEGLNWLLQAWTMRNSVILADDRSLGKTIQTICFLYYLFNNYRLHGPFLCVVPLSKITSWQREFAQWAPEMNIVTYLGNAKSRNTIRQYEWRSESSKRLKFNVILTTYRIAVKDKAFLGSLSWAVLLVDEVQRLKNDESLLYKTLMEFDTNHRLLITKTLLQNNVKELWALLHFIMPQKFDTWEEFEKPHILRRAIKDVKSSLPKMTDKIICVEMTPVQKQVYKSILIKNYKALRKGVKGSTDTLLKIVVELKNCCNHTLLTKPTDYESHNSQEDQLQLLLDGSGKLALLNNLLMRLHERSHRVLICSQMIRMLDILSEFLQLRHYPFQRIDSGVKGEMRKQALDHFNDEESTDFCFLLSTRIDGLDINLATTDVVIIFDSDWNPLNDLEAQAKVHRLGQKDLPNIYRFVSARSVEEKMVDRAKQKIIDHFVIQRMDITGRTVLNKNGFSNNNPFNKEDLAAILKFGAEEMFKEEESNCDIDENLRRAQTKDDAAPMSKDEILFTLKVTGLDKHTEPSPVNHSVEESKDWDEIIPKKLRKKVEEKEKESSQKKVQQINQSTSTEDDGKNRKGKKKEKKVVKESSGSSSKSEERPIKKEKNKNSSDIDDEDIQQLQNLTKVLHDRCCEYIVEHAKENNKSTQDKPSRGRKRVHSPSFKVSKKKDVSKPKRQKKLKETKPMSTEITEIIEISSNDEDSVETFSSATASLLKKNKSELEKNDDRDLAGSSSQSDKKEKKKDRKVAGRKRLTILDVFADLNPSVIYECKKKMNPVKDALKALDNPDRSLSEDERINHTRLCLIQIGERINYCLRQYSDPDKIEEWKSNLWYFASRFTKKDSQKLYNLYKRACKKGEDASSSTSKEKTNSESNDDRKKTDKRPHDGEDKNAKLRRMILKKKKSEAKKKPR